MAQKGTRKGISLPINMVVILAIAVLVLVVVAGFFVLQFTGGQIIINDIDAWGQGCATAQSRGCNSADFESATGLKIPRYDPQRNDEKVQGASKCLQPGQQDSDFCKDNTLYEACRRTQNGANAEECKTKCCGAR